MADRLLDVIEVASQLKVVPSFIYARTRANAKERIPHIKLGKYLRFDPHRLAEWIATHERGGVRKLEAKKPGMKRKSARTPVSHPRMKKNERHGGK
jgi:hypothetical protein